MPPGVSTEHPAQTADSINQNPRLYDDPPSNSQPLVLPLFITTIFLSSFLVFSVQPMFAKMVLPLLGGSPGVWNTAMLFFQIMLLLGYIYAHLTTKLFSIRWQAWLHVTIMATVLLTLPINVASGWVPPVEEAPVPWLIGLFVVSVGLPFFAVATNAPLLQRWFSHTGHSAAADPYFLYGASNLGSILALLSYPLMIEPLLKSQEQSVVWAGSYVILMGLIVACGITLWKRYRPKAQVAPVTPQDAADRVVSWGRRLHWLVLAMVPSSLLLGVTMHITTEVAAVPLLWVLPLTLYLLTFVFVFARRSWLAHSWLVWAHPFLIILLALSFDLINMQAVASFFMHISVFFVTAMVCHGELARRRPQASHLTEFYLWMSLGGMLGGIFNVIVAPMLFNSIVEYPLMLVLACLLRPRQSKTISFFNRQDILYPALLLFTFGLPLLMDSHPSDWGIIGLSIFFTAMGLVAYSFHLRPLRFGLGIATIFILVTQLGTPENILTRERNFFGVKTVIRTETGNFTKLVHGRTVHGAQHTDPRQWTEPLTYYHQEGPLGQIFSLVQHEKIPYQNIGVIGLGIGTIACYQQPNQHLTFYEIDPSVGHLAQDTRYFHFLDACKGNTDIVYGDGRLSLANAPDNYYDLIIIDAFSSDAIPVHLMTREALHLYMQKLSAHGLLMFHISNHNLDLAGVTAQLAADSGLIGFNQRYQIETKEEQENLISSSTWVIMTRQPAMLATLREDPRWTPLTPKPTTNVWTDDFSNIVGALKIWLD